MTDFIGKQTLPHRPHIDHLRKQAKARLIEMRAAQPAACLADAQRAVAREYGFSTWGALRAAVMLRTGAAGDIPGDIPPGARRRRSSLLGARERALQEALLDPATPPDPNSAFFLSGAATNIGVLFIIVAIVMALWILTAALPGWDDAAAKAPTAAPAALSLEDQARMRAQRRAEQQQPRMAVPFDPERFDVYAGVYQLDRYDFLALTRAGEHFFGQPVGGSENQKLELYPESATKFFVKAEPGQIEFVPDAQGRITEIVVHGNGFELSARKVDAAIAQAAIAERDAHIRNRTPWPGTEKALRRYIAAFQSGRPNYDEMIAIAALLTLERVPKYSEAFQKWGALTALTFIDVNPKGFDRYLATFAHGRAEMAVEPLSPDGKIRGITIAKIETL